MTVVPDGKIGFYFWDGVPQLEYKQMDSLGQKQMANGKLSLRALGAGRAPCSPSGCPTELKEIAAGRWREMAQSQGQK